MLWEVERILKELKEIDALPQILLMENVPQIHNKKNMPSFTRWINSLEEMGYSNYWQDLIATDYGIPQTRNRTFMVSTLGNKLYKFPKPIPLKLKLKDLLEEQVDEKYYLSDKMIDYLYNEDTKGYGRLQARQQCDKQIESGIAVTITTRAESRAIDNFVPINDKEVCGTYDEYNNKINDDETIGTIQAMYPTPNHGHRLLIKNNNSKGYLEAEDGDGVDISSRMEHHRGTVQKEKAHTLDCTGGEGHGVVVNLKRGYPIEVKDEKENIEGLDIIGNYSKCNYGQTSIVNKNGVAPTVTENHGEVTAVSVKDAYTPMEKQLFTEDGNIKRYINSDIVDEFKEGQMATTSFPNGYGHGPRTHNESIALNTIDKPSVKYNLRIRKLTPRECGRLMGLNDDEISAILEHQSDASAYHLFGDSIVTNILSAIFSKMLYDDE